MRKAPLLLGPLLLAACTAQIIAHQPTNPRIIDSERFAPLVIEIPSIAPVITEPVVSISPVKPKVTQPKPRAKEIVKVQKSVVPRAIANSNPKKYALSVVGQKQFNCLEPLWERESGWRWNAHNRSSGAYGIPQALPGSKMKSAGEDWKTNPITQVKWGIRYVNSRYGSACGAWNFWRSHHWY
jgi:hypothetical protein